MEVAQLQAELEQGQGKSVIPNLPSVTTSCLFWSMVLASSHPITMLLAAKCVIINAGVLTAVILGHV